MSEHIKITAKLFYGEDDDLIRWWREIPELQRSETLRQALRAYLGRTHAESDLEIVLRRLDEISQKISDGIASNGHRPQADNDQVTTMRANLRKMSW